MKVSSVQIGTMIQCASGCCGSEQWGKAKRKSKYITIGSKSK